MRVFQVDSFAEQPFKGNPAGVCLLDKEMPDSWMQNVAMEMNLSETAFLQKDEPAYSLRWFTPRTEVSLCGHGTLASAHIVWEQGIAPKEDQIVLHSKKGPLTALLEDGHISLDFPAMPATPVGIPAGLGEALGTLPLSVYENELPAGLVEVDSAATVRGLEPDIGELRELGTGTWIVTARSDTDQCDFVSRFFAPGLGIDEDPVTGAVTFSNPLRCVFCQILIHVRDGLGTLEEDTHVRDVRYR